MTYFLNNIPNIDGVFCGGENRKEIAKSLNLKYNVWKHKNGVRYHILKYDKEWLSKELIPSVGMLRSVIFKDDGKVVSFAPPKSLPVENLMIQTDSNSDMGYVAETFVEGTMINVFYETETNSWEIATRKIVGKLLHVVALVEEIATLWRMDLKKKIHLVTCLTKYVRPLD
jgi:hypothetical protein